LGCDLRDSAVAVFHDGDGVFRRAGGELLDQHINEPVVQFRQEMRAHGASAASRTRRVY